MYQDCEPALDDEGEFVIVQCQSPGVLFEATYSDEACTELVESETFVYGECFQNEEGGYEMSMWDGDCQPEETTTETPVYDCGSSLEECNQAYMDAMSVTCPPTQPPTAEPSLYTATGSDLTVDDLVDYQALGTRWMFNQQANNADVQEAFGLNDGNTLGVAMTSDGNYQYVVYDASGRVYETCVGHGDSNQGVSDCPEGMYCLGSSGTVGAASNQRNCLLEAAKRNDYKWSGCASLATDCLAMSYNYFEEFFVSRDVPTTVLDNLCVDTTTADIRYVMLDAYKNICIGFGGGTELCPPSDNLSADYFCSGVTNGEGTFGWTGQLANAIEVAYNNAQGDYDNFVHPQCRM